MKRERVESPAMLKTDAVAHFGSEEKLAIAIGLTRQAVNAWPDIVPQGNAYKLQVITGGQLQVRTELYAKPQKQPAQAGA